MLIPETDWEEWKGVLLTLKDEIFFDLMRNYLGELKTPFNKHNFVRDLYSLMGRPDFQALVLGAIDDEDRIVLSALAFLNQPTEEELIHFLHGSFSWLNLHTKLLNLEERLLIFRQTQDKRRRIRLCPLFRSPEFQKLLSIRKLFPVSPGTQLQFPEPWFNDSHLLAVFSFIQEFPQTFGTNGLRRKKVVTEWEARFPLLESRPGFNKAWALTEQAVFRLGLAWKRDDEVILHIPAWKALAELPPDSRRALVWAAAAGPMADSWRTAWKALPIFLQSLPRTEAMAEATFQRWSTRFPGLEGPWRSGLADLGVLIQTPTGDWQVHPQALQENNPSGAPGVLPANFELTLKPGVTLAQGFTAARLSRLKKTDTFYQFEIHKAAGAAAFASGLTAQEAFTALEKLTGAPLSQNITFSIGQWEKEFQSFRLFKGTVLVAAPERVFAVEHSPGFADAVERVLAPGVFLLKEENLENWRKELAAMNLATLPPVENTRPDAPLGIPFEFPLPFQQPTGNFSFPEDKESENTPPAEPPSTQVLGALEQGDFTSEERSELKGRILRRVILSPEQVTKAAAKGEKMEAAAMDYMGKIRLAEQALHNKGDLLEIVQRSDSGQPERRVLRPVKVDRQGQEVLLVGEEADTNVTFRVFLSRLSFVRRLRSSLFS